jgi:hypothetical protein
MLMFVVADPIGSFVSMTKMTQSGRKDGTSSYTQCTYLEQPLGRPV